MSKFNTIEQIECWAQANKMQFGFELEGQFGTELLSPLTKYSLHPMALDFFHDDGSVDWSHRILSSGELAVDILSDRIERDGVSRYAEYSSPVFQRCSNMIEALGLFTDGNYGWNYSGGMHVHISSRDKKVMERLRKGLTDMDLMRGAYKEALGMCEHQKMRLDSSDRATRFYKFWDSSAELQRELRQGQKYRFMNLGRSETIEFRFFAPCSHKAENVTKFMGFLAEELTEHTDKECSAEIKSEGFAYLPVLEKIQIAKAKDTYKLDKQVFKVIPIDFPGSQVSFIEFESSLERYREFSKVVRKYWPGFYKLTKSQLLIRFSSDGYIAMASNIGELRGWSKIGTMHSKDKKKIAPAGILQKYIAMRDNGEIITDLDEDVLTQYERLLRDSSNSSWYTGDNAPSAALGTIQITNGPFTAQ